MEQVLSILEEVLAIWRVLMGGDIIQERGDATNVHTVITLMVILFAKSAPKVITAHHWRDIKPRAHGEVIARTKVVHPLLNVQ